MQNVQHWITQTDCKILAAFPLHAFLFAKLISLFNFWGQYLHDQTNWWCLMFTLLAVSVGISYFVLGWSSNTISFVSVKRHLTARSAY